ncbi:MAG: hypothetical protein ABIH80_03400, partial [Methanobacteriota archaeon]
ATAEYNLLDAKSGTLTATSNEPEIGKKVPVSEATSESATPSFEIGEVAPTPVPTPELPFTPIIEEEEVQVPQSVTTQEPVITPVPVSSEEIKDILYLVLGCNNASTNESIIACSLIKAQ